MKKPRVFQVAKDLHLSTDALVDALKELGIAVKSHMSTLEDSDMEALRRKFNIAEKEPARGDDEKKKDRKAAAHAAPPAEEPAVAAEPAPAPAETAPRVEAPRVEPARVEAPRPEPVVQAEPPRVEPARVEPARVEPARVEAPRPEPAPIAASTAAPPAPPAPTSPQHIGLGSAVVAPPPATLPSYMQPSQPRPRPGQGPRGGQGGGRAGGGAPIGQSGGARMGGGGRPDSRGGGGPRPGGAPGSVGVMPLGGGAGATRPSGGGGGGAKRGRFGGGAGGGRGKKKSVDERQVRENIRKTMATLEAPRGSSFRRGARRRREDGIEEIVEALKTIKVSEFITVADLAARIEAKSSEVLGACLALGIPATINRRLDKDAIEMIADEFGFAVEFVAETGFEEIEDEPINTEDLRPRPPVVTIMGHVDHGKTSLLDYIRKSNVIAGEAGGITQHIGAYEVALPTGQRIAFLDTPGHEAFTAMRARGAQVTDIVILVVAADDRVMPQTVEAIDHAKAANVPIIVAINKIDKPGANPDAVRTDLAQRGLQPEEWGGKTIMVDISAKLGVNVDKLLEMVLLQSEVLELKAVPNRKAKGAVIEARVSQGRGVVGTVLVQHGTLRVGDVFVAGAQWGKVRALHNERGGKLELAGPSTPVQVLGWSGAPTAGDGFVVVEDERVAREIAGKRMQAHREQEFRSTKHMTLTDLYSKIKEGEASELAVIIKADVDGSAEALVDSLTKLSTDEVKLRIIHHAVGNISESDVLLAAASDAVIIGFHVRPDPKANELANREKVDIRQYQVIYEAVQEIKDAMSGLLKPESKEVVVGTAEVRDIFKSSKMGTVAGCRVVAGTIKRSAKARLVRNRTVMWEGQLGSLRRFKDDVREVESGFECGIVLDGFQDVQVDDLVEMFVIEEVARKLD